MSYAKPSKLPRWADNGGTTTEPSEAVKDVGYIAERPTFGVLNWLLNLVYQWLGWNSVSFSGRSRFGLRSCPNQALAFGLTFDSSRKSSLVTVGTAIEYAKYAAGYIYAATISNTVLKIDPVTRAIVDTFTGFNSPHKIEFDGTYLWVANRGTGDIIVIDPEDGTVIQTVSIGVGTNPQGIAFDGTYMWTAHDGASGAVKKIHKDTYAVTTVSDASFDSPHDFVFDGSHVWVSNYVGDDLSKVDISNDTVDATVAVGTDPDRLVFDGEHIWVSNRGSDTISKVSPLTDTVVATVTLTGGDDPIYMVFDGEHVWAALEGGDKVIRMDPVSAEVTGEVTYPGAGPAPRGICFDGEYIWTGGSNSTTDMLVIPA